MAFKHFFKKCNIGCISDYTFQKFNIQKFLYDFIKFDYNNVDEPYVRTDTFYMRYVGENLFLNAFRKLNLLKSF